MSESEDIAAAQAAAPIATVPTNNHQLDTLPTIDEQTKCEEMSVSPLPDNIRICLVGDVSKDAATVEAAESFKVPIVTSETGAELIDISDWITYFVMHDFESPEFEAIRKTAHRIYGPPALQQVARNKECLTKINRPVYNFAMKEVITCFTGIRKKEELTRLVNLIHSMGGSIRKELNSKVTHLICNTSNGEKYQYAMTFRLTVIRSEWVYKAWEQRDDVDFKAKNKAFTDEHRLKAFEGQRICFFGFSPDEHQHMVDVLKMNGGISCDLEDPECTHVIISNNADHFLDHIPSASTPELKSSLTHPNPLTCKNTSYLSPSEMKVLNLNDNENDDKASPTAAIRADDDHHHRHPNKVGDETEAIVVTPKRSKRFNKENCDGIVLTRNEDNEFLEPSNLSPILQNNPMPATADGLQNIQEEEEDGDHTNIIDSTIDAFMSKRKRDSFDNISMISTDSLAPVFSSAKKPKLTRTGSITRTLRRSMSFVAMKNPISNMIRSRRNSVDPNASINSVTSIESTFNESIKKPVKEKLRNFKARIMKSASGHKGEFCLTPKTPKTVRKFNNAPGTSDRCGSPETRNDDNVDASFVVDPFKTPLAPPRSSALLSASKSHPYHAADEQFIGGLQSHPLNNSTMLECSTMATNIFANADIVECTKHLKTVGNVSSFSQKAMHQHPDIVQCSTAFHCDGNASEVTNANNMPTVNVHRTAVLFMFIFSCFFF